MPVFLLLNVAAAESGGVSEAVQTHLPAGAAL